MKSRREVIRLIGLASLSIPLLPHKALACLGGGEPIVKFVENWTPKNALLKFYEGTLDGFFNREYQDHWIWSNDIRLKAPQIAENHLIVPISVRSDTSDLSHVYCSQVDIVYKDKRSSTLDVVYLIASFTLQRNSLPEFSTRYRMSSKEAKVYAALTYRDTRTDKVAYTKISSVPATTLFISCGTSYQFLYSDA